MQKVDFIAICPFELEDKAKIVLQSEPLILSASDFIVSDILATYSVKTGAVVFKIVLKDELGRELAPRKPASIMLITDVNSDAKLGDGDILCKKCGGRTQLAYKHIGGDEEGEGGYNADIYTCTVCGGTEVFPD